MPRAAQAHDHALFHVLAAEYALLFEVWAASFPEGANVLVVGHSPHLEMMAFGLFGTMLTGLRECEGFRVIHAPASRLDHGTPDLDPRLVRQALFP